MSLINQVLRDLDQRHAGADALPTAVRPFAATGRHRRGWRGAALAGTLLACIGAATGVAWSTRIPNTQMPPRHAEAQPATRPARSTPPVAVTAVTAQAGARAPGGDAGAAPRIEAALSAPVRVANIEAVATRPAIARRAASQASAPAAADAPAASAHIDKRDSGHTAHERAAAAYQRAADAHQQGRLAEAAAGYAAVLHAQPRHAPARHALAGVLVSQGRGDEARALLSEGLQHHPGHAAMALMLARLHADEGEFERAADILRPIPTHGAGAEDLALRAAILQRLARHAEAAEQFASALRLVPQQGVWWMGLAISLAASGRDDDARQAFQRAHESGSLSPELARYVEQRLRLL